MIKYDRFDSMRIRARFAPLQGREKLSAVDFLSIALSGAGLLQSIKTSSSRSEKKALLEEGLKKMDSIYEMLRNAKTIHDNMQVITQVFEKRLQEAGKPVGEADLAAEISGLNDNGRRDVARKVYLEFRDAKRTIRTEDLPEPVGDIKNVEGLDILDPAVRSDARMAVRSYRDLYASLETLESRMFEGDSCLEKFIDDSNFGRNFQQCIVVIDDQARAAFGAADQLIIRIAPILSHLHGSTVRAVADL